MLKIDGFNVTKHAAGHISSYLIDGFQIAIIKTGIKETNKKERNKILVLHAHTWTHKLIPKVYIELKSYVWELSKKMLILYKARKKNHVKYSQSSYSKIHNSSM